MLYLARPRLDSVAALRVVLADAVKLEHATIPPYMTALFTIKQGTNVEIARLLGRVVREEMLHMCLIANVLNAIGGSPSINASAPTYPGPLPLGIGSEPGKPLIVSIRRLSRELVHDVFMAIEEPDTTPGEDDYCTIGEFY